MEFNKYKELGDYHWREWKSKTTYGLHAEKVSRWVNGESMLDIGAGDGLITHLLHGRNNSICIGVDDDSTAVSIAREKGVPVFSGSAYDLRPSLDILMLFSEKKTSPLFDSVLMADVIEHLEYPDMAMMQIDKVLSSGGRLYITTPPALSNGKMHDKYHYREYTSSQLQGYIESFGYRLDGDIENKFVRLYAKFKKL